MVFCILDTGYKPDENQIRDHQAELEGAYNELLQLAAARRARLDESHKLQSFYRDAEEEEMWVSEKAHSLQSTDYGHDLNSAMILLNKHEVCGNYFSVSLIPDVKHDCIVKSFFFLFLQEIPNWMMLPSLQGRQHSGSPLPSKKKNALLVDL